MQFDDKVFNLKRIFKICDEFKIHISQDLISQQISIEPLLMTLKSTADKLTSEKEEFTSKLKNYLLKDVNALIFEMQPHLEKIHVFF